jgi:hypothetical protein
VLQIAADSRRTAQAWHRCRPDDRSKTHGQEKAATVPREILIKGHHEGYISWNDFERNQHLIADTVNRRSNMGRGSIRHGEALLAGLFRCARCGKKLKAVYNNRMNQRYACRAMGEGAENRCISFAGRRIDRAVSQEVIDRLQPFAIEAAIAAMNDHGQGQLGKRQQLENALEQARFEAVCSVRCCCDRLVPQPPQPTALPPSIRQGVQVATVADYSSFGG